jgi:hypothetical protein
MKTFKKTIICLAMLMVSLNVVAQRSTITMKGHGSVCARGFNCTLTVNPDGSGVIKGEATMDKGKGVSAITINFRHHSYVLFYQPTMNGGKGIKGDGFQWGYIQDITVSPFSIDGTTYKPTTDELKPKFVGTTKKDKAEFSLRVPYKSNNVTLRVNIEFQFPIGNAKVTTEKEDKSDANKTEEKKTEQHAPVSLGISESEKTITIPKQ